MPDISKSARLLEKAHRLIPGGTQTISKRPERFVPGKWPAYARSAEGCQITDLDGNTYIDYVLALGPIALGYNHPGVTAAVQQQVKSGPLFTFQSPLEVEVSELLVEHVPCADMVRFFKSGAEATCAAVRLARAVTGREHVISSGYAGWHDWWVAKDPTLGKAGVPLCLAELTHDAPFGDIDALHRLTAELGDRVACIIVEPKHAPDAASYLEAAREAATKAGAVLVFDEIVTGFRLALSGAQGFYGVTPDLATFGKAMANGYPLAALVGQRQVMEQMTDLWITTTFGGDAVSLAAAKAVIQALVEEDAIARIARNGNRLLEGWRTMTDHCEWVEAKGWACMPQLVFRDAEGGVDANADGRFVAHMLDEGILMRRDHAAFISAAHDEDTIDATLQASERALDRIVAMTRSR